MFRCDMVQPILFSEGLLFLVIGVLFSVFAEQLLRFQTRVSKKLFDITLEYTPKTIRIMRWFPGGFFVILGIIMFVLSFFVE